jgi:hypothetical protein
MARSGINKTGNEPGNIDALLGKSKPEKGAIIIKAFKLSEEEIEQVNMVAKMLGITNFSEGMRWCIKAAWAEHGDEIKKICKERDAIKPILPV